MGERSEDYANYLLSEHWSKLRANVFSIAKHECESCRSRKNLDGHHIRYKTPLEKCTTNDVMALCRRCHDAFHLWINDQGKRSCEFSRIETVRSIRKLIGQGVAHKKRKLSKKERRHLVKIGKLPGPVPQKRYPDIPVNTKSVLESVVFEQGKYILELQHRVTALEMKLATLNS